MNNATQGNLTLADTPQKHDVYSKSAVERCVINGNRKDYDRKFYTGRVR